jgi:CubicO group peptidase (beta-lactamase class C family)
MLWRPVSLRGRLPLHRVQNDGQPGGQPIKRRVLIMTPLGLLPAWMTAAAVEPEAAGSGPLDRLRRFFRDGLANNRPSGAVVMIACNGRITCQEVFGARDPKTGAAMQHDSIFRLYSMTKPVTAVAVLMLMEDGKIRLDDPAAKYLPALKNPRVLVEHFDLMGSSFGTTVPADREITIQDLLTNTSGITYGSGASLAEQLMKEAGIALQLGAAHDPLSSRITDTQMVEKIGQLPLLCQPGTAWHYGRSFDVLLALVEAVSGMRADRFYEQRIFQPLGMTDTFFNVPPDKRGRVAQPGPNSYSLFGQVPVLSDVSLTRTFLSGGSGLLSTAPDYMRFALMLAGKGELDGVRLLSPQTVGLMASDQIGPALARGPAFFPGDGYGFGFGVAVRTKSTAAMPGAVGEFNWGGAAGTLFWVDPVERLTAVVMTQTLAWTDRNNVALRSLIYPLADAG